jgi:SAM-dependent methyltransferase
MPRAALDNEARARLSHGTSESAIRDLVRTWLEARQETRAKLLDVGCGNGALLRELRSSFDDVVGVDILRHDGFPGDLPFVSADLDRTTIPLDDSFADVVTCVETIEHVESPRALVRELTRLLRPNGWLMVTTPNQLSFASKLGLVLRNEFPHFQERPGLYPAHISALLEIDLRRMLTECGLGDLEVSYTGSGRIPLTARHWPRWLSRQRGTLGTAFSDNVMICGRKPQRI